MKFLNARSIALAAAGVACAASANAQSSVTVYGVADMYLQYGKGTATTYKVESGGESGSRLGFKGSEDLGGGLKAIFALESGIGMDTGTITQGGVMWGRQSWVGLSSNALGTLTIGRLYNPVYNAILINDPFALGLGSINSSGIMSIVGGARLNNALSYVTPSFAGFVVNVVGAAGEGTTGKTWSVDGRYTAGSFVAGLTYAKKEAFGAQVDASSVLGTASYNFGSFKLLGEVQSVKNLTNAVAVSDDRTEYVVGAQVPFGPHKVTASIGGGKTKNVANSKATEFSVGYQYALSKRTDLYTVASFINNGNATAYTASGSTGIGPATANGQDVRALQVGIRHTF